ncbi:unnamed protein product, partial [Durusdinium trenchii]
VLRDFSAHDASAFCWAFSVLGCPDARLFEEMAHHLDQGGALRRLSLPLAAELAWAWAQARVEAPSAFQTLEELCVSNIESLETEDVCGFAWAFATADRAHAATREGTFRALQSYAERYAGRFRPAEVRVLCWVLDSRSLLGPRLRSRAEHLESGQTQSMAQDGYTATVVIGCGDCQETQKTFQLKPGRKNKVIRVGRSTHSDLLFGNPSVSWHHMNITLNRGSKSQGIAPHVTVKDLSSSGSAAKVKGRGWCRLAKEVDHQIDSGTIFALPCRIKPKAGEDLDKARCTFAVYFFEEEPGGGWKAPKITSQEFAELHTVPIWDTGEPTPFVKPSVEVEAK